MAIARTLGFARDVGDHVAFMDDGFIVEQGRSADVLDNPKNDRTKRFLGLVLER